MIKILKVMVNLIESNIISSTILKVNWIIHHLILVVSKVSTIYHFPFQNPHGFH